MSDSSIGATEDASAAEDASDDAPDGDGAALTTSTSFTPTGCAFTVAPRAEYTAWEPSAPTVGAAPNIRRVRLGLGGNVQGNSGLANPSTSSAFAWQTDDGTLASEVEWGTTAEPTGWPAQNRTSGVTWLTPAGAINPNGAERMHEVYVCGLTPATKIYYRVGGGPAGSETWSDVLSFTTAPAAGSAAVTFAFSGASDKEAANVWEIYQRRVRTLAPTAQLFNGDVVNLSTDQGEWEKWLDNEWKDSADSSFLPSSGILALAAHGQHDNHSTLWFGNMTLPQDNVAYPKYAELFYSVDIGPVHLVVLDDAFVAQPSADPDYTTALAGWLDTDLTAAKARSADVPWLVVMNERSIYSSSAHSMDADVLQARQVLAPIWQKYHVDLVLSGHDADYERTQPLQIGTDVNSPTTTTTANGTVFVCCAGVGSDADNAGTSAFTAVSKDFAAGGNELGVYSVISADSHNLQIQAHILTADGTDPIVDTYTLTK